MPVSQLANRLRHAFLAYPPRQSLHFEVKRVIRNMLGCTRSQTRRHRRGYCICLFAILLSVFTVSLINIIANRALNGDQQGPVITKLDIDSSSPRAVATLTTELAKGTVNKLF